MLFGSGSGVMRNFRDGTFDGALVRRYLTVTMPAALAGGWAFGLGKPNVDRRALRCVCDRLCDRHWRTSARHASRSDERSPRPRAIFDRAVGRRAHRAHLDWNRNPRDAISVASSIDSIAERGVRISGHDHFLHQPRRDRRPHAPVDHIRCAPRFVANSRDSNLGGARRCRSVDRSVRASRRCCRRNVTRASISAPFCWSSDC